MSRHSSVDSIVRQLFDIWKDSNGVISSQCLLEKIYFYQSQYFTLLEAKTIIRKSCSNKTNLTTQESLSSVLSNLAVACIGDVHEDLDTRHKTLLLIENIRDLQKIQHTSMDSVRRQICKLSNLRTLESHISLLKENFHLFGSKKNVNTNLFTMGSCKKSAEIQVPLTMSLPEFTNFLVAYFEYSDFFSYENLKQTYCEMKSTYSHSVIRHMFVEPSRQEDAQVTCLAEANGDLAWMTFPFYLELFCRIAILYSSATKQENEGQVREVESQSPSELENCLANFFVKFFPTSVGIPYTMSRVLNSQSSPISQMNFCVIKLREMLDTTKLSSEKLLKRYLFERRENGQSSNAESIRAASRFSASTEGYIGGRRIDSVSVNVTLIREMLFIPESLGNPEAYAKVLRAQHARNFELAMTQLHSFRAECTENHDLGSEKRLFFILLEASIHDSAYNDTQALQLYIEALEVIEDLSPVHPGLALAKGCVGTTLYYAGKFDLAQEYHQAAIAARIWAIISLHGKSTEIVKEFIESDNFNTAISMNNLACCLYTTGETECQDRACFLIDQVFRIYGKIYGPQNPRTVQVAHNMEMIHAKQLRLTKKLSRVSNSKDYADVISNALLFKAASILPAPTKKKAQGEVKRTIRKRTGESKRKQK